MGTVTRSDHDQFLELLCSDPDLLRAEFEAIVAAEYPEGGPRPPMRPLVGGSAGRPAGTRRAEIREARSLVRSRRPGVPSWARERSPPQAPVQRSGSPQPERPARR